MIFDSGKVKRLLLVTAFLAVLVYYLTNYTSVLGPYGTANDLYHQVIFVGLFDMVYIVFEIWAARTGRPR